ncbi:fasciclin domain-containing protein [Methanoculleus sp. FWC-SCC1]|uniref:Fasciclin domain-containing protein n=1 Tax=Methanoculleus frigidifontis TaxID=2584085 RepID=A0ABT8MDG8_9EURY|nr:fasciclin domain-containing protein [Methanoculleus sp. FWC-SCC1]MDN7025988.1 fasciclin domain-containing protein [Methanoculleus sp. FWC-SCC1]
MQNIIDTLQDEGRFSRLLELVRAAEIESILQGAGPFTLFAPTDAAFGGIPEQVMHDIVHSRQRAADLLTYHIVPERLTANDLMERSAVATLQGADLRIEASADRVMVNDAHVVAADIEAGNGVCHAIDTVLLTQSAAQILPR